MNYWTRRGKGANSNNNNNNEKPSPTPSGARFVELARQLRSNLKGFATERDLSLKERTELAGLYQDLQSFLSPTTRREDWTNHPSEWTLGVSDDTLSKRFEEVMEQFDQARVRIELLRAGYGEV